MSIGDRDVVTLAKCYVQAKRTASEDVDPCCDDDFVRIDVEGRLAPDVPDHSTAQHVRQSRESCKRVRANDCISPEDQVAALSLNHDEQEKAAPSTRQTSEASQQQLKLAQLLSLRGKQQQALQLLDAIIIANSEDADALCAKGKCFLAQSNHAGVSYCLLCSTLLATACLPHHHISDS